MVGTSERIMSVAYDNGNRTLYFGGSLGTIWKFDTKAASLQTATFTTLSVAGPVAVLLLDLQRSLLYAATTGTPTNTTQIFK